MTKQAQQRWLTGLSAVPCVVAGLSTAYIPYSSFHGVVLDLKMHRSATFGCLVAVVLALVMMVVRVVVLRRERLRLEVRGSLLLAAVANLLALAMLAALITYFAKFSSDDTERHELFAGMLAIPLCVSVVVHLRSIARVSAGRTKPSRWMAVARTGNDLCLYAPLALVVAFTPFALCLGPLWILLAFVVMPVGLFLISLAGFMGSD